jgi:hypothetical protein
LNDDTTSKRSSDTSIISHQSGSGSAGTKAVTLCQDEIIVEINSRSNENSDIDENGVELMQDDDEEDEEEEEANSEQKLLKCNNNNSKISDNSSDLKAQKDVASKTMHNGVGAANGFVDDVCMKIKMGW